MVNGVYAGGAKVPSLGRQNEKIEDRMALASVFGVLYKEIT